MVSAELAARRTAAAAVVVDFQRATNEYASGELVNPDWLAWAMRLAQATQQLLTVPFAPDPAVGQLAQIRLVLEQVLGDEYADRQYALDLLEGIAGETSHDEHWHQAQAQRSQSGSDLRAGHVAAAHADLR